MEGVLAKQSSGGCSPAFSRYKIRRTHLVSHNLIRHAIPRMGSRFIVYRHPVPELRSASTASVGFCTTHRQPLPELDLKVRVRRGKTILKNLPPRSSVGQFLSANRDPRC